MPRRTHSYAEDPSQPPILRYQASLPSLPVPPLSSTLAKYLESVEPLLTPDQLAHTKATADAFLKSPIAATLQSRLQERAARVGDNWLSEWWNDVAYMAYRDPVVVFVSYFFVHVSHKERTNGPQAAAALIKAMLPFRHMVESGNLEPEKVRGAPLCMDSYRWLFHASRYPAIPSDTARKFSAAENNHIAVLRKNRFFIVPLVHPDGQELSAHELEVQFKRIVQTAGPTPHPTPLGALTSDNRDNWTHARQELTKNPANTALLQKIESAMIVVCLDDTVPTTRDAISHATWVGNGRNRWYDKHQLIVYENGRSGFLGEHSCMDGTPTLRMNEFVLATLGQGKADLGSSARIGELPEPDELVFSVDEGVKKKVTEAEERFDELVGSHDLQVLNYDKYGKGLMKQHKTSPDAWAQLVKQLAFYRMRGSLGVTYESAQTRKFKKGRTEVIRSVSKEGKAWVEAMVEGQHSATHLRTLFQRAVARHTQYGAWAADGAGVDRHLFGLKKSLLPSESVPELFADPAFSKSNHWEMSTSQLSSPWFDGWGYGEVVPDGYGVAYAIGEREIRWTVTGLKSLDEGRRVNDLVRCLEKAAGEVKDVLERAAKEDGAGATKAKL